MVSPNFLLTVFLISEVPFIANNYRNEILCEGKYVKILRATRLRVLALESYYLLPLVCAIPFVGDFITKERKLLLRGDT